MSPTARHELFDGVADRHGRVDRRLRLLDRQEGRELRLVDREQQAKQVLALLAGGAPTLDGAIQTVGFQALRRDRHRHVAAGEPVLRGAMRRRIRWRCYWKRNRRSSTAGTS